jgi:hypothetical protein
MPRSHRPSSHQPARRWSIADAERALAAHAASGLSVAAFAARERLDVQRLHRWRRRLGATPRQVAPAFVEVQRLERAPVEVVLLSGRVLRVSESIDVSALRRLVDALEDGAEC